MRNLLTFVAVALVTALTVALVAPPFIDWSARREMVARAISARIGTPVEIDGPITLRLLPTPFLQVADVTVGPREAPRLRGKAMRFEFALANLIEGRIRLDDVVFDRPVIRLGAGFLGAWSQARLELGHIRANRAEIHIERAQGPPILLADVNLDATARSLGGPWRGGGEFALDGGTRAAFQFVSESLAGDTLPLKADVETQDGRAEFDGRLKLSDAPAFTGTLALSGDAKGPAGFRWPWRIAGEIVASSAEAKVAKATIRLGAQAHALEADGAFALRYANTLDFDADLRANTLNFDALLRADKESSAPPARAVAALLAMAQQISARHSSIDSYALKLESRMAYLGARAIQNTRLALAGAPGAPTRLSLQSDLPGSSTLSLEGALESGQSPIFRGTATGRSADFDSLAGWVSEGETDLRARLEAFGAILPSKEIVAAGDLELSREGFAARNLSLTVAESHFDGGVVYRAASRDARSRLFLDLASDALDIDATPNFEAGSNWLGDADLDLRLSARRLRVARVGLSSVESGSLAVRARKDGEKFTLEKLSLADFGGATIEAQGESAPARSFARVTLEAARLGDFAALLARAAPNAYTHWLLARAEDLGAAKATFELRRDGTGTAASFPLDYLKAEGVIAASRFNLVLSRAPAPVDAVSVQIALDAPDTGALLRKLGVGIYAGPAARGEFSLAGNGKWNAGFDAKARLKLAGSELSWSGALKPPPAAIWLTGPLTVKSPDLLPALAALGLAAPASGVPAPVDLTAGFEAEAAGARLIKLAGAISGSRLNGDLNWAFPSEPLSIEQLNAATQNPEASAKSPPTVTGDLELDHAWLPALLSLPLGRPGPRSAGQIWADAKFGPALLTPPSLDISLKVGAMDTGLAIGRSFSGRLQAEHDRLALDNVSMALNGGQAGGRLEIRRADAEATANGTLNLQQVGFERPNGRGRVDLSLDFAGAGPSPATLVGGLAGSGRMKLSEAKIGRFDSEALSRAVVKIEANPGVALEEKTLETLIGAELDKGALVLGPHESTVALSSGTLHFGPMEQPTAAGAASVAGDFRLMDDAIDLDATLIHDKVGRFWSGPPPTIAIAVKNALDTPARKIDAALLSAGLASEAIARENDRIENFEADVRERAMFNRRRKAELFLALRESEIAAFHEEQQRRELMQRYLDAYEAWASSRVNTP